MIKIGVENARCYTNLTVHLSSLTLMALLLS